MVYQDPLTLLKVVNIPVDGDHPSDNITDVPTPPFEQDVVRLVFGSKGMRKYVDVSRHDIPRTSEMLEGCLQGNWRERSTRTFYVHSDLPCSTTFLMFLQCMGSFSHSYVFPTSGQNKELVFYGESFDQQAICIAAAVASMADYLMCPKVDFIIKVCYNNIDKILKGKSGLMNTHAMDRIFRIANAEKMRDLLERVAADSAQEFCKFHLWNPGLSRGMKPRFQHANLYNKSVDFRAAVCKAALDCLKKNQYSKRGGIDSSSGEAFKF